MRLRYQNNRSSEVTHLISCQPTALKAVRLQSLVPPNPDKIYIRDLLVKNEVRIHKLIYVYVEEYLTDRICTNIEYEWNRICRYSVKWCSQLFSKQAISKKPEKTLGFPRFFRMIFVTFPLTRSSILVAYSFVFFSIVLVEPFF